MRYITEDQNFTKKLDKYAQQTSKPDSMLLEELWELTKHHVHGGQMLCGPIVGHFLHMMVKLLKPKLCFEIGTFTGYSALHIASALHRDSLLITCERNPIGLELARKFIGRSPDGYKINLWAEDLKKALLAVKDPIDFAFVDACKREYPEYHELLIPKMRSGGLIIYDNTIYQGQVINPTNQPAEILNEFNHSLRADPRIENVHLPLLDGLHLARVI